MKTREDGRISSIELLGIFMLSFTAPDHIQTDLDTTQKIQDKQSAYNVTSWHVRVTTSATKMQQCVLRVLLSYTSLSTI